MRKSDEQSHIGKMENIKSENLLQYKNHSGLKNLFYVCTVGQKKKKTFIYFNTNYCTEMKLIPIIMNYSLLQFDALNFS